MIRSVRSIILVFILVTIAAWIPSSRTRADSQMSPAFADSAYDLINAVNVLRATYGLAPYVISPILMASAQGHADYLAATGTVSHTGLGGSSVTDRILAAGYPLAGELSMGGFRSENIIAGSEAMTVQAAVSQWTGDAPHLTTMTSPHLTEIGAGVTVNGGRVYYVIDCAQPTTSGVVQTAGATVTSGTVVASPGSVILPIVIVTPNANGDVIHEVKAGQSLWQIAIAYETKIDEIKRLNNLLDNNIYPGDKLLIRNVAVLTPTAPIEPTVMDVVSSPTNTSTLTPTIVSPTVPPAITRTATPVSTNTVMGIAIGIIALALLGGGVFIRLGSSNKPNVSKKERL
jgi:uncharacterized protein YkwD